VRGGAGAGRVRVRVPTRAYAELGVAGKQDQRGAEHRLIAKEQCTPACCRPLVHPRSQVSCHRPLPALHTCARSRCTLQPRLSPLSPLPLPLPLNQSRPHNRHPPTTTPGWPLYRATATILTSKCPLSALRVPFQCPQLAMISSGPAWFGWCHTHMLRYCTHAPASALCCSNRTACLAVAGRLPTCLA